MIWMVQALVVDTAGVGKVFASILVPLGEERVALGLESLQLSPLAGRDRRRGPGTNPVLLRVVAARIHHVHRVCVARAR